MIKRIVVELEEKEHKAIKTKCVRENKTMREVVRTLLTRWVKK